MAEPKPFKEILAKVREMFPEFPPDEKIMLWKEQAPGNSLKVFVTPDQKWAFLLRAISGLELATKQKEIPKNASDPETELSYVVVASATLWTNMTPSKKLDAELLRTLPAGLTPSLYQIVEVGSYFMNPTQLFEYTIEV